MAKSTTRDLTTGSPMRLIVGFLLPMLFGLLFQQFYNMVDTIVVGKCLGVDALAGVGSTGSINFLVIGFCTGVCSGFAIPVAQKFGQRDYEALRKYVGNILWLAIGLSVVITTVTCLLCAQILRWMNTSDEIFSYAYQYIFLIFLGIPATFLYNTLSGLIRALGDSRTPLLFLILSSLLNIALDLLSVTVLEMGVEGPGLATVISQAVSGILCLLYVLRRFPLLHPSRRELRLEGGYVRRLLLMGLPMGLQYSITAIGSIALQSAVNTLGTVYVASVTAGSKVSQFFFSPMEAMGSTLATYAGQNAGAGKLDRVGQGLRSCILLGIGYALAACLVLVLCGDVLANLFLDTSTPEEISTIRSNAHLFLIVNSAFYIPLCFVYVFRFTIQGLSYSLLAVFAGVFEMVARCVISFGLVPVLGYPAVCFASPAAWIMADLFLIPAYFYVMRQLRRQAAELPIT
jgi:putative MATE family efflux protein